MSDLGNRQVMADNIRHYMKVNGVSQTDVCNTLGFKMPTFSDWVNAKTYPRIDKIEMMANYFGVQKSDLVEKKPTTVLDDGLDPLDKQLMDFVSALTVDQKRFLLAQLQTMKKQETESPSSPDD